MKYLFVFLFLIVSFFGYSQSGRSAPKNIFSIYSIDCSNKFFHDNFDRNLKSINNIDVNSFSFESFSFSYISNAIPVHRGGISSILPGYIKFSYLIPKKILMDFEEQNLRGFNFTFSVYGHNIIAKKNFSLMLTEGFNLGRLKLVNQEKQKMKNMIIAPFVGLVTRLSVSKFNLFAIVQYDYDISSKMWKKQWFHKGQDIHIPGIRQSGLTLSAGVGYSLGY